MKPNSLVFEISGLASWKNGKSNPFRGQWDGRVWNFMRNEAAFEAVISHPQVLDALQKELSANGVHLNLSIASNTYKQLNDANIKMEWRLSYDDGTSDSFVVNYNNGAAYCVGNGGIVDDLGPDFEFISTQSISNASNKEFKSIPFGECPATSGNLNDGLQDTISFVAVGTFPPTADVGKPLPPRKPKRKTRKNVKASTINNEINPLLCQIIQPILRKKHVLAAMQTRGWLDF